MSSVSHRMSFITSVSSVFDSHEEAETYQLKIDMKEKLKSRIFLGRYVERRLADKGIGYRDIVIISPAEIELKRDLLEAEHKLRAVAPEITWIGITQTETLGFTPGLCIWTEIDNQPFGPFWFQIKSLKFREQEIIVTIKCLRYISDSFLELEPILTGAVKKRNDVVTMNVENSVTNLSVTCTDVIGSLKDGLSISNLKDFITFLFAIVIAMFTGSTSFVNFVGNFVLSLIREMSILIKNSTPMFLGLLEFFSKIVGGFYILIAMIFRQSTPVPYDPRSIQYNKRPRRYKQEPDGQFD